MGCDTFDRITAVVKESRHVFPEKCVKDKAGCNDEDWKTYNTAAAFCEYKDSNTGNENVKESESSCAAGKLLEVNDNIEPADGSNQCKDNIVPWKMVAWQFLCCREKKESKHLHKGKVSCAKDLCRYHSRKTGIELENYKCN